MGRSLAIFLRLSVIACAVATILLCVGTAHAQDDRYGYVKVPASGVSAPPMPAMPPAMPQAQGFVAAPGPDNGQGYAPAPMSPPPAYAAASYSTQMPTDPQGAYQAVSNAPPDQGGAVGFAQGYILGAGDKVHVSVFGEDDLTGDYQIDGAGMVRLPLVGTLRAAGYTAPALETGIAGALSRGYLKNPRVNVEISTYRPFYIIGAVNKPGEYPYTNNMSALNAIAVGGGFTDQAKQSTVYVRHENSTTEQAMPADALTRIYPGDVVRVRETVFWSAMQVFAPLTGPAALGAAVIR